MSMKGKPLTFKEGSVKVTPYKSDGTADTANAVYLITKGGTLSDEVEVAEASANCVGKIRAAGARSVTIEVNAYASADGGTGNTAGTTLTYKPGDLVNLDLKAGLVHYQGEFLIEKIDSSFDASDFVTVDFTFSSNGEPTVAQQGIVTCVAANQTSP